MNEEARAARYSDLFGEKHEHASDCAYCPICATIAVVRNTNPEVLEHLANAARELIVAAGILLEEASEVIGKDLKDEDKSDARSASQGFGRAGGRRRFRSESEVRRIDIS